MSHLQFIISHKLKQNIDIDVNIYNVVLFPKTLNDNLMNSFNGSIRLLVGKFGIVSYL